MHRAKFIFLVIFFLVKNSEYKFINLALIINFNYIKYFIDILYV